MKQYKSKSWQIEVNGGIDCNVTLFGVNIFNYDWISTGECVELNLSNGNSKKAAVYKVNINNVEYKFAATEVSMAVWVFATYRY